MKRKQKRKLAIGGLCATVVVFGFGAYLNGTSPPELPMSDPSWYARATERSDRDFHSWILMGGSAFGALVAASELVRQARKLKI